MIRRKRSRKSQFINDFVLQPRSDATFNVVAVCRFVVIPQLTFKSLDELTLLSLRRRSIKAWSQRDVGTFLKTQGLEEYQSAFKEKKISGPALIGLNDEDLKEMGVSRKKERTALLKAVSTATAASTPNAVASYESAQKKSAKKKQQQASYDDDDVADAVKVEAQTSDVESDSIAAIPNIKGLIGIILLYYQKLDFLVLHIN